MRDSIQLAPTPTNETCAQVGDADFDSRSKVECRAFQNQLTRMFPPVGNARFVTKSFPHDFGVYREVCVEFDDAVEAEVEFAYRVEGNLPHEWDESAKIELASDKIATKFGL